MAHPATDVAEAFDAPANDGSATETAADIFGLEPDEEEEESSPVEGDDELEAEAEGEETQDESDEPEAPAIDAPVSWGTDAKELFSQLPPELQTQVAEREAQREKVVQRATTEAAEAKRTALIEAETAVANTQRQYASELAQYAEMVRPQMPDPSLAQTDPQQYVQEFAYYNAMNAQYQQMIQQSQAAAQEAGQREQTVASEMQAAEIRKLVIELPEWSDPEARKTLLTDLETIGAELGYSPEAMAQAGADDILALKKASDWKSKAAKYDALQKSKMEKVRTAKTLPKVVRPGVAPTRGEINSTRVQESWNMVKTAKSKDAQSAAFADYLESAGIL